MDIDEFSIDDLFSDIPTVHRLGFFSDASLDLNPDYREVIDMLHDLEKSDEPYMDEQGYNWHIISSIVEEENRRVAWIEWSEKEQGRISYDKYYLKARDDSGALLMWEIQTYNPYFGCTVRFLNWIEDAVILIYEDKHDSFVVRLRKGDEIKRIEISSQWEVKQHTLLFLDGTKRLKLPSLEII